MIPVAEALHNLTKLREWVGQESVGAELIEDMLFDIRADRYYVPPYPPQPIQSTLAQTGLGLHSAFILKVLAAHPVRTQSVFPRFTGAVTMDDARLLLRMLRKYVAGLQGEVRPVKLDELPIPATTAGILFTGYWRGEFQPVVWIHRDLTPGEFSCWMQLALAVYMTKLGQRFNPPGGPP